MTEDGPREVLTKVGRCRFRCPPSQNAAQELPNANGTYRMRRSAVGRQTLKSASCYLMRAVETKALQCRGRSIARLCWRSNGMKDGGNATDSNTD